MAPLARMLDVLFPPRPSDLALRALPDDALSLQVDPELVAKTNPRTIALLPFRDERVRAAIHEAKYYANARAARLLGTALAAYLSDADLRGGAIIIPLPLSGKRLRERGFNQCERIARAACALDPSLPFSIDTHTLFRVQDSEHQARLEKSLRQQNVLGAFEARGCDARATYLILDDVVTTGATLQAAIAAMRNAGAKHLMPLALAH